MEFVVDIFRLSILNIFGWFLLVVLLVLVYHILDSYRFNPFKSMWRNFVSFPTIDRIVLCVLLMGFFVYGSTKSSSRNANQSPARPYTHQRTTPSVFAVTEDDIAHGWRLTRSTTALGLTKLPTNALTNDLLSRRGGAHWAFRVEPPKWFFPYRDGTLTGISVFARGEIRPNVRTKYFPVPITNGLSLLPESRWSILPDGEVSIFRHTMTTNGSLILDWHNALVNRNPNTTTNLQIELFQDGRFAWHTDAQSQFYHPVFPFDWDGDGLENSVDPKPLFSNSIDAHGTNAEWFRITCSNVFEVATGASTGSVSVCGGAVQFKDTVNNRAYYFVEVTAENGPAPIYFNADRDSILGSPVIVARTGETNHVPLLVGVEYSVTSPVPFSVVLPENGFAEIVSSEKQFCKIKWPLFFEFVEDLCGGYVVNVLPYNPGGTFSWSRTPSNTGTTLFSSIHPSACGCWSGNGSYVSFNCSDVCTCYGGCHASGIFTCQADFSVTGGVCRCSHYDAPHSEDSSPHPPDPQVGSLSITFSKTAVVFEDAYANSPNDIVSKRSTTTCLTISASGGVHGGTFTLQTQNLSCLTTQDGTGPLAITPGMALKPGQTYHVSFICSAARKSQSENDIRVYGEFIDSVTGESETSCATITAVQIEVVPEIQFPENLPNRHSFGVCEQVGVYHFPSDITGASWQSSADVLDMGMTGNKNLFQYLLTPSEFTLTFTYDDVNFPIQTSCMAPSSIVCHRTPTANVYPVPTGQTGGVGMHLALTLCPSNVSFSGIRLKEAAAADGIPNGYFNHNYFSNWWKHTEVQGANRVVPVGSKNDFGDNAAMMGSCPPLSEDGGWSRGSITWHIPVKWREPSMFSISRGFQNVSIEEQRFTINTTGTVGVEKFNRRVQRPFGGQPSVMEIQR